MGSLGAAVPAGAGEAQPHKTPQHLLSEPSRGPMITNTVLGTQKSSLRALFRPRYFCRTPHLGSSAPGAAGGTDPVPGVCSWEMLTPS